VRNWEELYSNQDLILNSLKDFQNIFTLGGGTALHRFLLFNNFRYSEDLDFFLDEFKTNKKEVKKIAEDFLKTLKQISKIKNIELLPLNDGEDYRLMCFFENKENVKIDILNFSLKRIQNYYYLINDTFKVENFYDLMLYKISALCSRMDGIKDLFDLYFIFQEFDKVDINKVFKDLNDKLSIPLNRTFTKKDLLRSLENNLKWNISLINQDLELYAKKEIKKFQKFLYHKIENDELIDFSVFTLMENRAKELELDSKTYYEIMDYVEDNKFLSRIFTQITSKPNFSMKKIYINNPNSNNNFENFKIKNVKI